MVKKKQTKKPRNNKSFTESDIDQVSNKISNAGSKKSKKNKKKRSQNTIDDAAVRQQMLEEVLGMPSG